MNAIFQVLIYNKNFSIRTLLWKKVRARASFHFKQRNQSKAQLL
jgi:hypothetical protein